MAKLTVNELDVRGKRVFVRVDYNVPMEDQGGKMVVTDATRILATLPTLESLISKGARLILAAHLGRPKGKVDLSMSLRPVAEKLANAVRSLRDQRVLDASDGWIYGVTVNGYGALMPGYGGRIAPDDRWHIVNYVRALQGDAR